VVTNPEKWKASHFQLAGNTRNNEIKETNETNETIEVENVK